MKNPRFFIGAVIATMVVGIAHSTPAFASKKKTTLLIYMAADNDLFPYALMDLKEMEAGSKEALIGSTGALDVVAEIDTPGDLGRYRIHVTSDQQDQPLQLQLKIEDFKDKDLSVVNSPKQALPETSESPKAQLEQFLNWGIKNYPAENYLVVIWGHGAGWGEKGIARDDSPNLTWLSVPEVAAVLDSVNKGILKDQKGRIDLYASDACSMQSVEVATEMGETARYISGSSQLQNFLGLPYRQILHEINSENFAGLREKLYPGNKNYNLPFLVARMIPQLLEKTLDPLSGPQGIELPKDFSTLTFSSLETNEFKNFFLEDMNRWILVALKFLKEKPERSFIFKRVFKNSPKLAGGTTDLGVLMGMMLEEIYLQAQGGEATALSKALYETSNNVLKSLRRSLLEGFVYGPLYLDIEKYNRGFYRSMSMWVPLSKAQVLGSNPMANSFMSSKFYKNGIRELFDEIFKETTPP